MSQWGVALVRCDAIMCGVSGALMRCGKPPRMCAPLAAYFHVADGDFVSKLLIVFVARQIGQS